MKSVKTFFGALLLVVFSALSLFAGQQVDLGFKAVPSKVPTGKNQIALPDGKVLVWGSDLTADAQAKGKIARLNSDGSVDQTFDYCGCNIQEPNTVFYGPDGKIYVGGTASSPVGPFAKVIRLNPNGSLDVNYNSNFSPEGINGGTWLQKIWAMQPDGKLLVQKDSQTSHGNVGRSILRLNADGTIDTGFSSINATANQFIRQTISDILVAPDGKIYLSYWFDTLAGMYVSGLGRYNADGTGDGSWGVPSFTGPNSGFITGPRIWALALKSNGNLIVTGVFDHVNGLPRNGFVQLDTGGNVNLKVTTFGAPGAFDVRILPSGKIMASTGETFVRLNSDGSPDGTFLQDPTVTHEQSEIILDPSERLLIFGNAGFVGSQCFRLNPNGDLDPSYNTKIGEFSKVSILAQQPDGKILVIGDFVQMNGTARSAFARINADGTFDATFNPGTGFNTPPSSLTLQPDGKIIALGPFSTYDGTLRPNILRINTDGSLDGSFTPTFNSEPKAVAVQSNGQIVAVGGFTIVNGAPRTGVARLNASGAIDPSFNPIIGSADITAVLAQVNGSIMISGSFSGVNGFSRTNMARLNADGSTDGSFNTASSVSGRVFQQIDGKYLLLTAGDITRRNNNGSADASFAATSLQSGSSGQFIDTMEFQPDGKMLIGGKFSSVSGASRTNFARINANGGVDTLFNPANKPNGEVKTIAAQPNGRVVIGGDFDLVGNVPRSGMARFAPPPAFCDFDGDGRSDLGVFRPSNGLWYQVQSQQGEVIQNFGIGEDLVTPGDFDGDGKVDLGVFRPSTGMWWYRSSVNTLFYAVPWGTAGDIPMASDFDGDGKTDFVYYRPSNGTWYRDGSTGQISIVNFGLSGDIPVVGDFDGDGKTDPAIFRPSNGFWWYLSSVTGAAAAVQWGQSGDIPVPADYDGDGKTDIAVFRASLGGWYIYNSSNGSFTAIHWGFDGDKPVPADYDGDGRADAAIWRPSNGMWFVLQSTSGPTGLQYGLTGDKAIPSAFIQ